jgi:DNA-binding CsgD family transcriptional regulator/PAS domain-containing protein
MEAKREIPHELRRRIAGVDEAGGALFVYHDDVIIWANEAGRRIYASQNWGQEVTFDSCFRSAIEMGRITDPTILCDPEGHLNFAKAARARQHSFHFRRDYDGISYDRYHVGFDRHWNAQVWFRVSGCRLTGCATTAIPSQPELLQHLEREQALSRLSTLLEQMGIAVAIVTADCRIVDCSPAMGRVLQVGLPLICDDNGIVTTSAVAVADRFKKAVGAVCNGTTVTAIVPVHEQGAMVPTQIGLLAASSGDPVAIITVLESGNSDAFPSILAAAYSLTPAEAEVAVRIARGESPETIASTLRKQTSTVRKQLDRAKKKISADRQHSLAHIITRAGALVGGIGYQLGRK